MENNKIGFVTLTFNFLEIVLINPIKRRTNLDKKQIFFPLIHF